MLPRVVIVGGGFGGLSAARALRNDHVNVTLIDRRNYHLFRPMLYQVATGLLSGDEISSPLRSIFSRQKNVQILFDEVTGINSDERVVHLSRGDVTYDYLILATGIQYNYFGHDEWRNFAAGLESLDDADIIRGKILRAFERAEEMASMGSAGAEEIRRQLTFALVGGGTVGVEMASTLAEMSRIELVHDFRHIDPASARILLYEGGPRILPAYPEALSINAQRHLESLGVAVLAIRLSRVWIQMELSQADRRFWPALYSGELVSSRLRRDDGYAQKLTSLGRSWWNRTCHSLIIRRFLPLATPLISLLRFEIYLASNRGHRC